MMKLMHLSAVALMALGTAAMAEGDAAKGEDDFKKCRSCHTIANGDEVIYKGGRTGPNLYNIVGRTAGTEDFKYSSDLVDAGANGLVWTEESIVAYVADPTAFLRDVTGNGSARSKMTFKMKGGEDVAAYLASVSPGS
jgi:cytochrome c